jgi:hypothetical protein
MTCYIYIGIWGSEKHETSALIHNQLAKYNLGHGISTRHWSNEKRRAAHQLTTYYIPDGYIVYLALLSFRWESSPINSIHFQHYKGCTSTQSIPMGHDWLYWRTLLGRQSDYWLDCVHPVINRPFRTSKLLCDMTIHVLILAPNICRQGIDSIAINECRTFSRHMM